MGAYFIVVNPAKKQFLDPFRFGEAIKFSALLRGDFSLLALKLLIADHHPKMSDSSRLEGSWVGDPVILASDDTGIPNPDSVPTTAPGMPDRNLNQMAHQEFTDISYAAIAMLCRTPEVAAQMASAANQDESFLIDLGNVLLQYDAPALQEAIVAEFGTDWRKKYKEASEKDHTHFPVPKWEP